MPKFLPLSKQSIVNYYQNATKVALLQQAQQQEKHHFQVSNLVGSSLSFVISETFKNACKPYLLICDDKEEAAYYLNDLEQLLGEKNVLFYPDSYRRPYQIEEIDNVSLLLRSEVLNRINSHKKPAVIVTYPTALFEKVVTKKELEKNTLKINQGENLSPGFINEILFEYNFNRVNFVTEPGEFSIRGGIIDVFSFSNNDPYRIEFFSDEIDSIRTFDIETQLSKEKLKEIDIMPDIENKVLQKSRESFLKYISSKTVLFVKNLDLLIDCLDEFYRKAKVEFEELSKALKHPAPSELFCNGKLIASQLNEFTLVSLSNQTKLKTNLKKPFNIDQNTQIPVQTQQVINEISEKPLDSFQDNIKFNIRAQPSFNKQFNLLIEDLNTHHSKGYTNYIFCSGEKQAQRFHDIFDDAGTKVHYKIIVFPIYQGFIDEDQKIVCYTDHQIFERYHKFRLKNGYAKKQSITFKELTTLKRGDYVTHIDHGVGKFAGLQKIDVAGKKQEAIKLIYSDRDILYVSIHSLHKISKFNSKDGKAPKIYKLGSGVWKKVKQKTKARVKEIAFNLIQLYAKRKLEKGFAFAPDTHIQHELEASFLFEDTPDQFTATQEVKADMEKNQPMDRLVCGDVGFGKTEVAIRAAFKAVDNGKQVAVLVPTTILAFQHFKTFSERLKHFPVHIDYINRFRTAEQKRAILEGLTDGSLDIVIGTHQLTNKNIAFKDLGLLIIDEEQKFGVAVKDKLKTIKKSVDTLTLTATPIPRTLQFSLMAARDLSVIKTPPPNRHPIETNVIRFSEEVISDAILYEISRKGQIFFIHNKIENIEEVSRVLQRLIPSAKIGIGHGQMEGKKLEKLMLAFMNGEFDVLVSTTIVESGLDVPNANTIFINNANHFGLSDLYQMRGRVGRSNRKAFCYFITPPYHMITEEARKRIQTLEMFSELGSGLNIAIKDLEIRGAGDLLGGEQSGFINDIGFDTYQKILKETIEELKENEFENLYASEINSTSKEKEYVKEVRVDTDFEILFPDDYVNSVAERLNLYNTLSTLTTESELLTFESQITDRFGKYPTQVQDLLDSVRIKWLAKSLGLEKIILKQKRMIGYFVSDQQSDFYQTEVFTKMLKYVQHNSKSCVMKEKQTKSGLRLLVTFIKIDSINRALKVLINI